MAIILKNGRGQIGGLLRQRVDGIESDGNIFIYHTWNIDNKSKSAQKREYNKFKDFVQEHHQDFIMFISTKSKTNSHYVKYKQMAESYLIQHSENALVLQFPTLIGKGVIKDFKEKKVSPYGTMELMTLENAVDKIIKSLDYSGLSKVLVFEGEKISANLIYNLVNI